MLALLGGAAAYGYSSLKQEYTVTCDSYTAAVGSISNALSLSGNLALLDSASYTASSDGSVAYCTATVYMDVEPGSGVYPGMQVTVTLPKEAAENVVILKMDALSFDQKNRLFTEKWGMRS